MPLLVNSFVTFLTVRQDAFTDLQSLIHAVYMPAGEALDVQRYG